MLSFRCDGTNASVGLWKHVAEGAFCFRARMRGVMRERRCGYTGALLGLILLHRLPVTTTA